MVKKFSILIIFIGAIFTLQSLVFYDPDFWWHIKVGELIRQRGIPRIDPFSYTMPSFSVVSHEWSIDILLNFFYINNLYWLLAIIFSVCALAAVYISTHLPKDAIKTPKQLYPFHLGIFILGASVVIGYMGIRPQVLSWLFVALLLYFLSWLKVSKNRHKFLLLLPIGFILWANIHGSFAAGLAILAITAAGKSIRTRKLAVVDSIAFGVSVLATLVNPYGIEVWREVLSSVLDSDLRWRIQEWQPSIMSFNLAFICFLAFALAFVYRYHRKFILEDKLILAFFTFQSIASTRHVPIFVIIAAPLIIKGSLFLYKDIKANKASLQRLHFVARWSVVVFGVLFIYSAVISFAKFRVISPSKYYPVMAVNYLKDHLPQGNVFSEYSWGGYLIWHLPTKKVFIDGRMPSWEYSEEKAAESKKAMDDYVDLIVGKMHHKKLFEKYQVDIVLWPKNKIAEPLRELSLWDRVQKSLGGGDSYYFDLIHDLKNNGWQKVYEDDIAVIYQKPVQ